MLQFSANLSVLFTELPLIERFQAAKEQGFQAVEIQFPYELSADSIRAELEIHQLKLVLFNIAADDLLQGGEGLAAVPEKQKQFNQALVSAVEYAKVLQPEAINVLAGCCFDNSRLALYQKTFSNNLRAAVKAFSTLGIKTVFEAINTHDLPHFIISTSEQQLALMTDINHPDLYLQYDIYHAVKMAEDPASFIAQYIDKIAHIQFADYPNRHEPETGNIDFSSLFSVIKQSNYTGWVGAEYKPLHATGDSLAWLLKYTT